MYEETTGRTLLQKVLLILLLAETGFRIGELLGVDYVRDIDYEAHFFSFPGMGMAAPVVLVSKPLYF